MASLVLLRRPGRFLLPITAASSIYATTQLLQPRPSLLMRCDTGLASSYSQYQRESQTPVTKQGRINPRAIRQISTGSILGLVGGLAVSVFSKPLTLLIGLLIIGVQYMETKGIHLIPYNSMQKYFKSINLRSAVQDNVAFKLSFGAVFALAAFAEF